MRMKNSTQRHQDANRRADRTPTTLRATMTTGARKPMPNDDRDLQQEARRTGRR